MGHTTEYLVWREKNGFFTALDKRGSLQTWSLLTGKKLYSEEQKEDASYDHVCKYEVYKTDEKDITYTRDFYNLESCSLNLLKSKQPADDNLLANQTNLSFAKKAFDTLREKMEKKNRLKMVNRDRNVP